MGANANTTPLSSHDVMWAIQETPGGPFTDVAELGDIMPPEFSRKEFDSSVHNKQIDSYVLGILRRGAMTVPLNLIPNEGTHDHLTGLYKLLFSNTITGHQVRFPTTNTPGGATLDWIMSGQIQAIKPKGPVDGKLEADVTIRFSGVMSIGGVLVGS